MTMFMRRGGERVQRPAGHSIYAFGAAPTMPRTRKDTRHALTHSGIRVTAIEGPGRERNVNEVLGGRLGTQGRAALGLWKASCGDSCFTS